MTDRTDSKEREADALIRKLRDVLDEARSYIGAPTFSPSMDREAAIAVEEAGSYLAGRASLAANAGEPWTGGEEWEALAWHLCAEENGEDACGELIWEGGPIPEPWGDRWMKYEPDAKRMIELVRKFVAAPPTAQAEGWRQR